ncbi:MAG: rod shape-determining protein MreD [candidate division WOR-3 bacterium]|nr:rod shape-determining protein MreD [candidate division WOR-3 bacterium]
MKIFIVIILSILALFLSLNFMDLLSIGNISFKPLILLLYFVTLYWNPWFGLFIGFFLGFLYGIFFSVPIGLYPLIFTSVAFGLYFVEKRIYKYNYRSLVFLFFVAFFVGFVQLLTETNQVKMIFLQLFIQVIPESILTTLIGLAILYFIKKSR